jgi:hypothetical protein
MAAPQSITVTLPPALAVKAQEAAARQQVTVDELVTKAVSRYVSSDPEWEALLERTRAAGREMGIQSEADVERLSDEFRAERRERSA